MPAPPSARAGRVARSCRCRPPASARRNRRNLRAVATEEPAMEQAPDRKRVQEFARRLFGHYTSGMLTLMVDIGHRTGLFEAAAKGPGTSGQLAERAGLNERYVREWLGAMATGGIMGDEAASRRFAFPADDG